MASGVDKRALGQRIRNAREAAGIDREEFASRLGVHVGSVARWEVGGSSPNPETCERIAEVVGAPVEWLLFGRRVTGGVLEETPEDAAREDPHGAVIREVERSVRYLGGLEELDEEERRLRQIDYLQGAIRLHQADGNDVAPLYELLGRVTMGEFVGGAGRVIPAPDPREEEARRTG